MLFELVWLGRNVDNDLPAACASNVVGLDTGYRFIVRSCAFVALAGSSSLGIAPGRRAPIILGASDFTA
jgi:hypothetical protein